MVTMIGDYEQCRTCRQEFADDGIYPPGTTYTTYRRWWGQWVTPHRPGCADGWRADDKGHRT